MRAFKIKGGNEGHDYERDRPLNHPSSAKSSEMKSPPRRQRKPPPAKPAVAPSESHRVDDWVLGPPVITLYATKRAAQESQAAFRELASLNLGFEVAPSTAPDVRVEFAGRMYAGLSSVERLVNILRRFQAKLLAPEPEFDEAVARHVQPNIRERSLRAVAQQVEEAQRMLSGILG